MVKRCGGKWRRRPSGGHERRRWKGRSSDGVAGKAGAGGTGGQSGGGGQSGRAGKSGTGGQLGSGAQAGRWRGGRGGAAAGPRQRWYGRQSGRGGEHRVRQDRDADVHDRPGESGQNVGTGEGGYVTIQSGGGNRGFALRLPANYDKNKPYWLIFGFHWNGGTSKDVDTGGSNGYAMAHSACRSSRTTARSSSRRRGSATAGGIPAGKT